MAEKKIYYSASDITNFEICKCHVINKVREKIKGTKLNKRNPTRTELEYQKQGEVIELSFLSKWLNDQESKPIMGDSLKERIEKTNKAILKGQNYIYQPCLKFNNLVGYPDLLKKISNGSYEVMDIKRSKEPKKSHVTQIQTYNFLLTKTLRYPINFHIINGPTHIHNKFRVKDSYDSFIEVKDDFLSYVSKIEKKSETDLEKLLHEECVYNHSKLPFCETIPNQTDLINVVGLNKKQKKILKPLVKDIEGLSEFKTQKLKGISEIVLQKLIRQSDIQHKKIINGKPDFKLLPIIEHKGFNKLPRPNQNDLFFDIEGDPTVDGGHEYLFGIIGTSLDNFLTFWSEEYNQEQKAFEDVMDFLKQHILEFPDAHIYHYNHYEVTQLKRMALKYDDMEVLDFLLRNKKFVDLYPIVRESLITSEKGISIKDLEIFYMKKRETEVISGSDSVDQFLEWKENKKDTKILQQIEDYNQDDCKSTKLLLDWLHKIKPKDIELKKTEDLGSFSQDSQTEYKKTKQKVLSVNPDGYTREPIKELISNLLEYHKRENKSQWWLFFDRRGKDYQELIDDMDAIGDCHKLEYYRDENGNPILALKYANQFFKIREGHKVVNLDGDNISNFGDLFSVDIKNQKILIKTPKNRSIEDFPAHFNFGADQPIRINQLRASLYRFADNFSKNKASTTRATLHTLRVLNCSAPTSILELLNRMSPTFKNNFTISEEERFDDKLNFTTQALLNLDESFLFIQGPPGSGKTYTTAYAIIELMKKKKTVAVTSNSHKAINQVLSNIDELSLKQNFSFKGLRKSSNSNKDSKYESTNIESSSSKLKFLDGDYQLLAGTKFELSNAEYDGLLDYVFIDEAGQFSIADTIVCAQCAKNLVLIGDPKQLDQPSSITHPGNSGLSILDFFLANHNTVGKGLGIFIDQTRRMNAKINSFISDTFYDQRLISHISTEKRKLIFEYNSFQKSGILTKINMPSEGIVLIETNHEDNSQNSEEEIVIIKKLYQFLLNQKIKDESGTRRLTQEDLLVIAPYNVQVNNLSNQLPEGNRTGTIHRFQGQEAPVSIVSMTSSDDENAPRGINFLFDPRSLNVAISRAQCLSIIIMNKALFKANANNIQQLKMINNFHTLRHYSHIMDGSLFK